MRDRVTLSCDLWLPEGTDRHPLVLLRTPYLKASPPQAPLPVHKLARFFASHGYAVAVQDVRGRGDSDGEFRSSIQEGPDGYDTIEWEQLRLGSRQSNQRHRRRVGRVLPASAAAPCGRADGAQDGGAVVLGSRVVGIRRARYRNGLKTEQLLTPGTVERYAIDLGHIAHAFQPGHNIRVEIASSAAPFYNPNQNTGNPVATATEWRIAHQTIHHDRQHPSALVLPVVAQS